MRRVARKRAYSPLLVTLIAVSAILVAAGTALTANRAVAVFHEITETGHPGLLVLSAHSETPLWVTLQPGETRHWLVQAALHDAPSGSLSVELVTRDLMPETGALEAEVIACEGAYDLGASTPSCSGAVTQVVPRTSIATMDGGSARVELVDLYQGDPRQILVSLTMPSHAAPINSDQQILRVGLGVHSSGDDQASVRSPDVGSRIAITGTDATSLGLLAAGLIGLAAALLLRRRRA